MRATGQAAGTPLPLLLILGGAPGSGKTTLALRLGEALALPVFTKDGFKESLYESLGAGDQEASRRLGVAALALLSDVAARLLAAGVSVLIEANYQRGLAEADLRPLAARARTVLLHCGGDVETIVRRYQARAARGERHPGHHDGAALPRLRQLLGTAAYEPLDLGVPLLRVDTTTAADYAPGFAEIVRFVRAASPAER